MAVGDVWRLVARAVVHGQQTINTFYYEQTAGGGIADITNATNLANAVLAADWWDGYLALHSDEWTATTFGIQRVNNNNPGGTLSPTYDIDIVDADGTTAGNALPTSMAFVIRRRTNLAGRRGYGRIYLTGFPAAWEVDSVVNTGLAAFVTAKDLFINNANTDLINAGITWAPRHYAAKNDLIKATPIRQWAYDSVLRNQRRRQIGVGI